MGSIIKLTFQKMKYTIFIFLGLLFLACDENDVMPAYEKKGTATATVATIAVSNDEPESGETITLTLMYVNPTSDPIESVVLMAKIGSGDYTILQTFDGQSSEKDVEITEEVQYVAPDPGAEVTFDMVITSQKEYPQIKRTSIEVVE